jgi:tetratricopeptide (TPR) repeat protein
VSCLGYAEHRNGEEDAAISTLRRALKLDPEHAEARIYLANVLYDKQEYEAALYHFDKTQPEEHWDELGIWRLIELKKAAFRYGDDDPELKPWIARVEELQGETTDIDELLAEIEAKVLGEDEAEPADARGQLELFGSLLAEMVDQKQREVHVVVTRSGDMYTGDWDDIVHQMRDATASGRTTYEFMLLESKRIVAQSGHRVPTESAEAFVRGCIEAGVLRLMPPS